MFWLLDADSFGLDYLLRNLLGDKNGVPQDAVLATFDDSHGRGGAERQARRRASEMVREGRAGMVLVVEVSSDGRIPPVIDRSWPPVAYSARWVGAKYAWRLLCSLWGTTGPKGETPCENPNGPWMLYKQPGRTPQSRVPVCGHCHERLGPTEANRDKTAEVNRKGRRKKEDA